MLNMGRIGKTFALFLTFIFAVSCLTLLTVKPVEAQTGVTQPTVPGFDVVLRTFPDNIPPTYGVDPSTGKAVMTKAGYHEEYVWVDVDVGGQPFWQYNNSAGQLIKLFYGVRWKSNLDASWQTFPSEFDYYRDAMDPWDTQGIGALISIGFIGIDNGAVAYQFLNPNATEIGFQVEALIGYYNSNNVFIGQSSGWSNTQTLEVSIPSNAAPSSTPAPSPPTTSFIPTASPTITQPPATSSTPSVPEYPALVIVPLLFSMFFVAVILSRHRKNSNSSQNLLPT